MRKMWWMRAAVSVVMTAQAATALAVDGLEGEKPKHKVKAIGELDENAPRDISGKVQFIPTLKGKKQMRAQQRHERLARKAEHRKQKAEERKRLRSLHAGTRAARKAKKATARGGKKHGAKVRAHKPHTPRGHHRGRKHKHRAK